MCFGARYISWIFFCFLICTNVKAQIRVTAIPSKAVVSEQELFQIQFVVEGTTEVEGFTPPAFRGLQPVGEVVISNGWNWVNGALAEYVSYTYQLRARNKGKIPVASAVAKIKGKLFTSPPFMVVVAALSNRNQSDSYTEAKPEYFLEPGEDVQEKIRKNLFVKTVVSKERCYVGEPILATFKLYTRLESESKILKRPSFNGFSVFELNEPGDGMFTKELVNGKLFNAYLIRRVMLFPLQSGEVFIEPVEIENLVRLLKPSEQVNTDTKTWIEAVMEQIKNAEITSDNLVEERFPLATAPVKIQVMELPEAGKPASFIGTVGNYSMQVQLKDSVITNNQNNELQVIITGTGNLNLLTTPFIKWPSGIEPYEAIVKEERSTETELLYGKKIFTIPFSAQPGTYLIPAIEFSFFNTGTQSYETLRSDSLQLVVKPGAGSTGFSNLQQEKPTTGSPYFSTNGLLIPAAIFLIALAAFFFLKQKKQTPATAEELPTTTTTGKPERILTEADQFLLPAFKSEQDKNQKKTVDLLIKGLQLYYCERLNLPRGTGTKAIQLRLQEQQHPALAGEFSAIVERSEEALFNPAANIEDAGALLRRGELLIQQSEQEINLL
jgi:hypothetical protein